MNASAVPRLETARLILREWRASDADAYAGMATDVDVMRYVGGVMDREQSWRSMALHAGHWTLRGYGNWAVERRTDGEFLGRVGLWNPEGWLGPEIGWTLARPAWGNGYATEAAGAAMNWAWTVLNAPRLIFSHPSRQHRLYACRRALRDSVAAPEQLQGQPVSVSALSDQRKRSLPRADPPRWRLVGI